MALRYAQGFSHSHGIGYFESYEEYFGSFAKKHEKIKQLKSQLTELDKTAGTST